MKLNADKIAGILREKGYKMTPQRRVLLQIIASHHDHLSPDELYDKARRRYAPIGRVTVYRTLELLDKLNLVCHVHSAEGCHDYMMRGPIEHHHHVVCSTCGNAIDFTYCDLSALEQELATKTGYQIQGHLLELYGICGKCKDKKEIKDTN